MTQLLYVVGVATLAAVGTWGARRVAVRSAQLDVPDRRRLHALPTPRGGGLGPILAWLLVIAASGSVLPDVFIHPSAIAVFCALAMTALIGAWDDRHDLAIRPRLITHCLAAALIAWSFLGDVSTPAALAAFVALTIIGVASINLHNFMDGADGFLSLQAIFVLLMLAALAWLRSDANFAFTCVLFAAALIAFVPFNFPKARVFLGDVGSGSIGLMIGALSLVAVDRGLLGWGSVVVLSSAFMVDAGATLVMRMRKTSRWHQGHRSHLYQWLWRRGWRAPAINALYQAWNLVVVLPVLLSMEQRANTLHWEFGAAILVYALGLMLWIAARRALRRAHRAQ